MCKQHWLLFLIIILLCQACKPTRPTAVTTLQVTFKADSLSLSSQRIIAGSAITLTITNATQTDHQWMLLSRPSNNIDIEPDLILHQVKIPAEETISDTFTAPLAPGEYPVICGIAGHLEKGESGKVLVVHPDYAR